MRARNFVLAALGCVCLWPATASAAHVQCGDTITQDTHLDSDVVCTAQDPVGLVIGADNIKLGMGPYTIQGADAAGTDGIADDGTARTGVTIRWGRVTGFEDGIDLDASDSTLFRTQVSATSVGIAMRGNGNYFHRNVVDMTAGAGFAGMNVSGDDSHLAWNSVTGTAATLDDGIVVTGNNPQVIYNFVDGCAFDGLIISGYSGGIAALNDVRNCDIGITPSGSGLRLQSSVVTGNSIGILVDDPAALVRWNKATGNSATGIMVLHEGAALRKNVADGNGEIGIDAPDATIDEGGNTASGNPVADCLGVICLPLPPD
jgi:hypothetical protein